MIAEAELSALHDRPRGRYKKSSGDQQFEDMKKNEETTFNDKEVEPRSIAKQKRVELGCIQSPHMDDIKGGAPSGR